MSNDSEQNKVRVPVATAKAVYTDGTGDGQAYEDGAVKGIGTNAAGNRTVSSDPPSGGKDGDIWYQI